MKLNCKHRSVIVSDYASERWIVSTTRTPLNGIHPVSGNRSWGFDVIRWIVHFYVTGADRLTATYHQLAQALFGIPFAGADKLWGSYQNKLTDFVNSHDGTATVGTQTKERPNYADLKDYFDGKISIQQLKAKGGCN